MKLCVFQGTFNPIHKAHLRVAAYVAQKYNFDKVLFIPAYNPPHKNIDPKNSKHRFNMVKLAIKQNPKFEISDIEFKRQGKSYTYETIQELYNNFEIEDKINFLIGTDAFANIENWYEAEKLKNIVKFILFVREDNCKISKYDYLREKGYDFEFQQLEFQDISSTELRNDIKMGKNITGFVTDEVEEYIKNNGLYQD